MTLAGRRVVITRAAHQAGEFATLIEAADGIPVRYPCIDITPPDDTTALDAALRNLRAFDTIIFTSTNTVYAIAEQADKLNAGFDPRTIRIVSIGDKTDDAVRQSFGRSSDFVPSRYRAIALADELAVRNGENILLPLSALSDGELADLLIARGADVTTVAAYQNVIGSGGEDVPALLRDNQIDALTFTSGSTVKNFVSRIAPQTAFDLAAVCIGPSTHEVAVELGFTNAYYPEKYTPEDMLTLLEELLQQTGQQT